MISIIIPAHNEATVIGRCLRAMTMGARPDELEIIVVCNGCDDSTAEIARSHVPSVTVLELEAPSKSAALNLGDRSAPSYPRFSFVPDIVLGAESLPAVAVVCWGGVLRAPPPRIRAS